MPETNYGPQTLYPETEAEYDALLSWCSHARQDAHAGRRPYEEKWDRYYRLYRSYINRDKRDWRSKVFMPETFQTIETILPRLVAQLPKFIVRPRGQGDEVAAKRMETLLQWATENSDLYQELLDVFKDTLMYGTGIIKTMNKPKYAYKREPVPRWGEETQLIPEPLIDPETGEPVRDPDTGEIQMQNREVTYQVPMEPEMKRVRYVTYEGPVAQCIDLMNFWISPEAEDVQQADYAIHRTFKRWEDVKVLIADGTYVVPRDFDETAFFDQSESMPHMERQRSVDMSGSVGNKNRKKVAIEEFWINDGPHNPGRVVTIANEKLILRVQENPFDHGEKPFIRFVDYKLAHEFYGIGEIEVLEGLQDLINALVNQRIDNVRLSMDKAWTVNTHQLVDTRDLVRRPGQVIRVKGDGMRPDDVVKAIDFGDVTGSAFAEVDQSQRMAERVTGASGMQQGVDTAATPDTATGMALMSEAGVTRFAHKVRQAEIIALRPLGYHFGSLLQQFTTEEKQIRLDQPDGTHAWETFDPLSLHGAFDYTIEPSSIQQSETVRREQALSLLRELAPLFQAYVNPQTGEVAPLPKPLKAMVSDLLEAFGKRTLSMYLEEDQPQLPMGQVPEGLPPELAGLPLEQMLAQEQGPPQEQMQ